MQSGNCRFVSTFEERSCCSVKMWESAEVDQKEGPSREASGCRTEGIITRSKK